MGTTLLFMPDFVGGIIFEEVNKATKFFIQISGSTLLGYGGLNLLAFLENKKRIYQIASWGNLITLTVASLLSALYIHDFDTNYILLPIQHIMFAIGFLWAIYKLK